MRNYLPLLLALVLLMIVLPFPTEATMGEATFSDIHNRIIPLGITPGTFEETEPNDSPELANMVRDGYTFNGILNHFDLCDFYYFEVDCGTKVSISTYTSDATLVLCILDADAVNVLAETTCNGYYGDQAGYYLETILPLGKYYIFFTDCDNFINQEYKFTIELNQTCEQHSYSYDYTVYPTCTEDGYDVYSCECSAFYTTNPTDATGHTWDEGTVLWEPNEIVSGLIQYICLNCGTVREEDIPPLEHIHDYSGEVIPPTCTQGGYTCYTCQCGAWYIGDDVSALGHVFGDWMVIIEATDVAEGKEFRICSRPGCIISETRPIPKLDHVHHDYTSVVTDPTCTEEGFTTYTCRCGDSYIADEVPALGHDFGDWMVLIEPTEEAEGEEFRNCGRCHLFEKQSIPKLDNVHHDYISVVTNPTCTEGGYTTYTCACGDSYVGDETPALGHDFVDGICTRCGDPDPNYVEPVVNPFTDVPGGAWYETPVLWAVENSITAGTGNGNFSPNQTCTRGQVVTFLWRAVGEPEPESNENPFSDVASGDYFYKAVLWAVENGITSGTGNGNFSPNNPCTRDQVVTFLWRAMGKPTAENRNNPFSDVAEGIYYYEPVLWAVEQGITSGTSATTFAPGSPCTRAQVVTFLYRAMADK